MTSHGDWPFGEFIRSRTGAEFVERRWLHRSIESALESESCGLVLVTGEPGVGKTSLSCGMAKEHDDWLRYFISESFEDGTDAVATGDIASFLISIGLQLSRARPELFARKALEAAVDMNVGTIEPGASVVGIRIGDLIASPFYRNARLSVGLKANTVRGSLIGVEIARAILEPRLLEPDNLAHLALVGPALALHNKDPSARITILLDALDEAFRANRDTQLLEWLATGPRLPGNVKIVVTSRPQSALGLLRTARDDQMKEILLDPGDRHMTDDLIAYAERTLATTEIVREAEARQLFPDQFLRHAARRAGGNFLYLASYERALKDAVDSRDVELMDRLFKLEDLPETLSGIYGFFVELAKVEIDRLGLLDIEDPLIADERTPAWEGVGQPLLGVLTVAREPLTEDQLMKLAGTRVWQRDVLNVLAQLRWLLYRPGGRVAFFHASVGEFLTGPLAREKHSDCWLDPVEWNERIARHYNPRIARHYRDSAATWAEVEWANMDRYGLTYLPGHVLRAKPSTSDEAVGLICGGFLHAVKAEFGVARPFLDAVDQIAHHIIQTRSVKNGLPHLIHLGLARNHAARVSRAVPVRVLGVMARVGRLSEALERVAELAPSYHRFAAMAEIAQHAECGPGSPTPEDLIERVIEYALEVPHSGDIDSADRALKRAAEALAPHNLDRALRLWERAHGGRRATPSDSFYRRAAAAERDPARARFLIGKLSKDRWRAYLDLAGRVGEPALARGILADAERSLVAAPPADRVRGLAELAKNWNTFDRDNAARLIAELRAEVFQAGEAQDLPQALADAAEAIKPVDADTARMLLTRLDLDPGVTKATLIRAAVLWKKWGQATRARAVTSRIRMPGHDRWRQYWLRSALGEFSREAALEALEEILAATEHRDAAPDSPEGHARAFQLVALVDAFSEHDLRRAAEIARQMPLTSWVWGASNPFLGLKEQVVGRSQPESIYASDRYSMLAWIAHRYLDRGERAEAMALLEEALAFYAGQPADLEPTGDRDSMPPCERGAAETRRQGSAAPRGMTLGEIIDAQTDFNASQQWQAFVKRHFFRDPADVVRAASTGPGSLAKTLRVAAEQLWSHDRVTATRVIEALDDAGERAIGLSALHLKSHDPNHGPESERLSRELDQALAELPGYHRASSRWLSGSRDYHRPEIRVRFEVALGAIDCRAQDALAIEEYEYMSMASKLHMYLYIVDLYVAGLLAGRSPRDASGLIKQALSPRWFAGQQHEERIDSMRAAIACREYRITRSLPGYTPVRHRIKIKDPIYATAMDLVAPTRDGTLSPAFAKGIRHLLTHELAAAAATLLAFAAEIRPEAKHTLLGLAREAITAAAELNLANRIEVLSYLASAPVLAELLDLAEVFDEAERAAPASDSDSDLVEAAIIRLFPALLRRNPSAAMRAFYQAVSTQWGHSMSLLESAAGELLELFGPQFAERIARPAQQGLACTAPAGMAPLSGDGVSFTRLLPDHSAEARQ